MRHRKFRSVMKYRMSLSTKEYRMSLSTKEYRTSLSTKEYPKVSLNKDTHYPVETTQPGVPINDPQSTNRYAKWLKEAAKRRSLKPFEERRIGWITSLPKEQVVCCGQSARDLCRFSRFLLRARVDRWWDGSLLRCQRSLLLALLHHHKRPLHRILVLLPVPLNPAFSTE